MIRLELPYPPSLNTYYRTWKGRILISEDGRKYREQVARECICQRAKAVDGRLRLNVTCHPPDNRRRDLDNALKGLLDALQHAGVYTDDGNIDELHVVRGELDKERPRVVVTLESR